MTKGAGNDRTESNINGVAETNLELNDKIENTDYNCSSENLFPKVGEAVDKLLKPIGFEAHLFQISWYNELVGPRFQLNYPDNTVAAVIISGPETFEKCIVPYVKAQLLNDNGFVCRDPLDDSMKCLFKALTSNLTLGGFDVDSFHDFDMYPNRKPKVLVQTAAHVAGCVEYYHRDRLNMQSPSWCKDWKLYGVAIHPVHGGWFAIRGVCVLKNFITTEENFMTKPQRPISGIDEEQIKYLLEQFGSNWQTNVWRDIIPRKQSTKYSQHFIDYLAKESSERWDFVRSLILSTS